MEVVEGCGGLQEQQEEMQEVGRQAPRLGGSSPEGCRGRQGQQEEMKEVVEGCGGLQVQQEEMKEVVEGCAAPPPDPGQEEEEEVVEGCGGLQEQQEVGMQEVGRRAPRLGRSSPEGWGEVWGTRRRPGRGGQAGREGRRGGPPGVSGKKGRGQGSLPGATGGAPPGRR